jgi:hypothetical protein
MRAFLSTRRIFVAVLVLGWFALAARNVVDPDVWWHLKTGEYIAAHRAVPHTDPFSYTRAAQPWVAHEWLSDLLIYSIQRAAGFGGLIVIFAATVAGAFFLLYLRGGNNSYVTGIITLLGAWATAPLWGVRPQMLSLLLTSLWLLILERSEHNRRLLWWTLPLTLLWVNLHAGFALGLGLLLLFFAGELIEHIFANSNPNCFNSRSRSRLAALAVTFLLDLALVRVNPNGAKLYRYPFETLHSRSMQSYIAEWASPNFHKPEYLPFLFLLLALVAVAAWSPVRTRPRDLLLLCIGILAALSSTRFLPFFVLVAVPIVAKAFDSKGLAAPSSRRRMPYPALWNAAALLFFAAFALFHALAVIRHQPKAEAEYFPTAAIYYLQQHPAANPIFNHYDWGGYIIWCLYPRTPVFVDGRADLYGEQIFEEFADTYQLHGNWQKTLEKWMVKTVIVPPDSALATALRTDSRWSISYEDRQAIVFALYSD